MGIYSEYINKSLDFKQLTLERKKQLKRISKIRNRDILVFASDLNKDKSPIGIMPADLLPFKDQLSFISSDNLDVILETPGGVGETVEDMVELIRQDHEKLGIIVPGTAKSAGTIFSMAGDEILMGKGSALGPIDAQIIRQGKRFSADGFLDGLKKIKTEVEKTGKLNPAYIPMLQNINPGEIQHFENAQAFSKVLVTNWLSKYKFKYWDNHSSTGKPVIEEEKKKRAEKIASKLCKHSDWLTHGRSIRIPDLAEMKLEIYDYSTSKELNDAISRYYTLLRITFDNTSIYKIFETCNSQIFQSAQPKIIPPIQKPKTPLPNLPNKKPDLAAANFKCPRCSEQFSIQLNLKKNVNLEKGNIAYPKNDIFACPNCGTETNLRFLRLDLEGQLNMKVIR